MHQALPAMLFAGDVAVADVSPLPDVMLLHPEEEQSIRTAGSKRRREFAAGRRCARRALGMLGIDNVAIPANPDRTPAWPAGVVGSITHTDHYCLAAVARCASHRSVGVDAEPDEPLEPDVWGAICTPIELRWLACQPMHERGRLVRLIFSAKECIYKAQYPLTGAFLEFHDAVVELDREAGRFTATLLRTAGTFLGAGARVEGHYGSFAGVLVTAVEFRVPGRV